MTDLNRGVVPKAKVVKRTVPFTPKDVSNYWWLSDPAEYYDVTWDDDEYWPRDCAQTINFDGSQIRIFPLNYNKKGVRPMIEIQFGY